MVQWLRHPANPDLTTAGKHTSIWWEQEGHPAVIAPVCQEKSYLSALGVTDVKFGHFLLIG